MKKEVKDELLYFSTNRESYYKCSICKELREESKVFKVRGKSYGEMFADKRLFWDYLLEC